MKTAQIRKGCNTASVDPRVNAILSFLAKLTPIKSLVMNMRPEKLFELMCYLKTANRLTSLNKIPIALNLERGIFKVNFNPGKVSNSSYLRFTDSSANAEDLNLLMNCEFPGRSGVLHCPDIVLLIGNAEWDIQSIYECKHYSSKLGISVYREFLGYITEMGLRPWTSKDKRMFKIFPVLSPTIFTSAKTFDHHQKIAKHYCFNVEDCL